MALTYGVVATPADLAPGPLPAARGPLSAWLLGTLRRPVSAAPGAPPAAIDDALHGEDAALALYVLYELHYRGFAGVDEEWEWDPGLLALRRGLERDLLARLRDLVRPAPAPCQRVASRAAAPDAAVEPAAGVDIVAELRAVLRSGQGRSLSEEVAAQGTLEQVREFAVHRSAYQLKEADPHTWAIPRLAGAPKAALVEIQADEYGGGRERDMHQNLFALTMRALDLEPAYGAYLDRLPATTLATVNIISFFGLHRRWRGALVGHLAIYEMASVDPMGRYSAALRRLGLGAVARHFFEVHVVADAHHEVVASRDLAAGLVAQEPHLAADVIFGAQCAMAVEEAFSSAILRAWDAGRSALRPTG